MGKAIKCKNGEIGVSMKLIITAHLGTMYFKNLEIGVSTKLIVTARIRGNILPSIMLCIFVCF